MQPDLAAGQGYLDAHACVSCTTAPAAAPTDLAAAFDFDTLPVPP